MCIYWKKAYHTSVSEGGYPVPMLEMGYHNAQIGHGDTGHNFVARARLSRRAGGPSNQPLPSNRASQSMPPIDDCPDGV